METKTRHRIRGSFLALFLLAGSPLSAVTYHVSPDGNDSAPGSASSPFATVERALRQIREDRVAAPGAPATIILFSGEYLLERPLVLYGVDSDLTIAAAPGAEPVLVGGRRLGGWKRTPEGWFEADLSGIPALPAWLHLLVVDGQARPRARLPETGAFEHETRFTAKWLSTTGGEWGAHKPTPEQLTTLTYREGDLPDALSMRDAQVRVYHMWDESLVPVAEHDPKTRTLRFGIPCGQPPGAFDVRKFVVFNVKEGMTRPGQWYHDRERERIVYRALPGEDMARARVFVPFADSVVRLEGDQDSPVTRVTLRRLTITIANAPVRTAGFGAGYTNGLLELTRTKGCVLSGLKVRNGAGYGLQARWAEDLAVEECDFSDLGAGGIHVSDASGVRVEGCLVEHIGTVYPSGIGLWTQSGRGGIVRHNSVRDTTYDGVCNGMDATLFEANRIERVMRELHDGAAFYSGFCRGVTMRDNVVRDVVDTGGYGASAYYIDEMGRDHLIENNLSVDVACASQNHMAKGNVLRGNLFVSSGELRLQFPKSENYAVLDNLLMGAKGVVVQASREALVEFSGNVIDAGSGEAVRVFLNDYNISGQEPLLETDHNRLGASGIRLWPDLSVEVPREARGYDLGIRFAVFKNAGCSRK